MIVLHRYIWATNGILIGMIKYKIVVLSDGKNALNHLKIADGNVKLLPHYGMFVSEENNIRLQYNLAFVPKKWRFILVQNIVYF